MIHDDLSKQHGFHSVSLDDSNENIIGPRRRPIQKNMDKMPIVDDEQSLLPTVTAWKGHVTSIERGTENTKNNRKYIAILYLILGLCTRYWWLSYPASIVWDETHFGTFLRYYIRREFFFDVHPPLGKMLLAFMAYLAGFSGNFEFKTPGIEYTDEVPYTFIRFLPATLGALCVPLVFLILSEKTSLHAASLAATMMLCDVGNLTISRFILLDPILMFFILCSVLCLTRFRLTLKRPFSIEWWGWMSATGILLGCTMSVKWVGLFVILFAGLKTAFDLWDLLGDLSLSKKDLFHHLGARIVCLIALPLSVYVFFFAIHFKIVENSGPGDSFMSSQFQSTLRGNELFESTDPWFLSYGSVFTLKNYRSSGGLLHSHRSVYPGGSDAQQQVTCYQHKDSNNHWTIRQVMTTGPESPSNMSSVRLIKDGDVVVLTHLETKRNLHSHTLRAPITTTNYQVTAYGTDGIGDSNDYWIVKIVHGGVVDATVGNVDTTADTFSPLLKMRNSNIKPTQKRVQALSTLIQLIHFNTGCALHSHAVTLPKWGFEQLEVTCMPDGDSNSYWNVEMNRNDLLPKTHRKNYMPSFLSNFVELNIAMMKVNEGLKPKENEVNSKPWEWPLNYNGQRFTSWEDNKPRVYLIGNPIIFFFVIITFIMLLLYSSVHAVKRQRGFRDPPMVRFQKLQALSICAWCTVGYFLHYLPFFLMGRVLYFHHYFPALLFGYMNAAMVVEICLLSLSRLLRMPPLFMLGHILLHILFTCTFLFFCPFSYGMEGNIADYKYLYLQKNWIN